MRDVVSTCAGCRYFLDDAEQLEREFPGILILSSAGGDTRGDQGLCRLHEKWVLPRFTCSRHQLPDSEPGAGETG
ncbi:MAG: hypothetical protein DRI34_14380 [Deltaproteobacteria bacterium]|nr:MAG: hypothetical protein DRI34_14380 [Deltaproteobacteria bacterium]